MESGEREDKSEMNIFFQNILEKKKEYWKVRGSFLSLAKSQNHFWSWKTNSLEEWRSGGETTKRTKRKREKGKKRKIENKGKSKKKEKK